MLHLEDIDHQDHRIPWLATYLAKNGTIAAYPPVSRREGVKADYAITPEAGFSSNFSARGEELLSSCFAALIHCLGARRCYVMLLDEEREELVVVKANAKGTPARGDRIALSQSLVGWVVDHKQPLISTHQGVQGLRAAIWEKECTKGPFLAVPISGEDELHGVLMACDKVNGATFSEHDLVTAEMLANHLALCIEGNFLFQKDTERVSPAPL